MHAEMAITRQADKIIGGHYASTDLGLPFHGYIAGGPQDDHEGTRMEDAIARARQGMSVMLRLRLRLAGCAGAGAGDHRTSIEFTAGSCSARMIPTRRRWWMKGIWTG